jgi:hypothetical protein
MDCSPLGDRLNFRAFERFPKGKMMPVSARHTENDFFFVCILMQCEVNFVFNPDTTFSFSRTSLIPLVKIQTGGESFIKSFFAFHISFKYASRIE